MLAFASKRHPKDRARARTVACDIEGLVDIVEDKSCSELYRLDERRLLRARDELYPERSRLMPLMHMTVVEGHCHRMDLAGRCCRILAHPPWRADSGSTRRIVQRVDSVSEIASERFKSMATGRYSGKIVGDSGPKKSNAGSGCGCSRIGIHCQRPRIGEGSRCRQTRIGQEVERMLLSRRYGRC